MPQFLANETGRGPPTRSPKSSSSDATTPRASDDMAPTEFFIRSAEEMNLDTEEDRKLEEEQSRDFTVRTMGNETGTQDTSSVFGVQSLEAIEGSPITTSTPLSIVADETIDSPTAGGGIPSTSTDPSTAELLLEEGPTPPADPPPLPPNYTTRFATRHLRRPSQTSLSQPLTPNLSPHPSAAPSTPKSISLQSLRLSDTDDDDDVASQAVTSGGEEGDEMHMRRSRRTVGRESTLSIPELVMPSLQMPARRPFTDVGRRMGRLKIMVVGRKGAGKSSLIRSMVQVCEDIVHIDPVQERGSWGGGMEWRGASGTTRITEIAASSRPLPGWWAELNEGAGMAKRRNSVTDVLDRNITFVDTPGLGRARDEELLRYVEGQSFKSISTATMSDTELLQLMCGNGSQVDLVLFLFGHQEELDVEMQMLERLAQSTNVIPIISRCDLLSEEQLGDHHARIAELLQRSSVKTVSLERPLPIRQHRPDSFGVRPVNLGEYAATSGIDSAVSSSFLSTTVPTAPYVVSSAPGPDDEIDASLLMSSTYLAPLHPSDLDPLVHWLFHPDNIAYLRASAAHKVVQWRKRAGLAVNPRATDRIPPPFSRIPTSPLSGPRAPSSSPSSSAITAAFPGSAAAFRAHVTREERLAQLRLSRWATELRGTVSAERERYERLTGDERAEWLARQLEREVARGGLVICEGDGRRPDEQRGMGSSSSVGAASRSDGRVAGRVCGRVVGQFRQGEQELVLARPPPAGSSGSRGAEGRNPEARRRRRKVLGDSGVPAWARRAEKERVGSLGGVAWQTVQLLSGVSFVGAVLIAVVRGWGKQGEALNWGWGW